MSKEWHLAAERGATAIINAVNLSQPDYSPIEMPQRSDETSVSSEQENDVTVLGKLLMKSGAAVAAIGAAAEILPESVDTVTRLSVVTGLGAAAIGTLIVGYEKLAGNN